LRGEDEVRSCDPIRHPCRLYNAVFLPTPRTLSPFLGQPFQQQLAQRDFLPVSLRPLDQANQRLENKYRDEVRSRVPRHVVAALAERTVFLWSKVRYSGKLVNSWCPTDSGKTRTTRTVARATVAENGRRTEWSQDHPCLGDLVPLPFCRI